MSTAEVRAVSPEPPESSPLIPQKVKVTIGFTRTGTTGRAITPMIRSTHRLPSLEEAVDLLPANHKTYCKIAYSMRSDTLENVIRLTKAKISTKIWANCIARAIARGLEAPDQDTAELIAIKDGGYLSLGRMLFKLDAVDWIQAGSRALPALRRKVMDDAKAEAESIKTAATKIAEKTKNEARMEFDHTTMRCADIRQKHEAMRRELQFYIPDWCRHPDTPVMVMGTDLCIRFSVYIEFHWFEFEHGREKYRVATRDHEMQRYHLWVPLNTDDHDHYLGRIKVDHAANGYLPHIGMSGCMALADAPRTINSAQSLTQLAQSIGRTMQVINCSSLLSHYGQWDARIKALVPEGYVRLFQSHGSSSYELTLHLYEAFQKKKILESSKVDAKAATFYLAQEGSAEPTQIRPGTEEESF